MLKRLFALMLARLDGWADRLYGWKWNPLYQSGAIVVLCLAVMLVTGIYLLFFYRIGAPHESIVRIDAQPLGGRWIRSLHRYAADLAVAAAVVHALRMFFQGRSWGPRALAWVSGVFLLFLLYVCGWTGYVMVWDVQGQLLATEGARLLDALPIFSEPVSRTFAGAEPLPSAFFFMNLFLHIAIPVGLVIFLWLHVSRVARPVLLPPRSLLWTTVGLLTVAALLLPAPVAQAANLLRIPADVPLDLFYAFWLPWLRDTSAPAAWLAGTLLVAVLAAVPILARPRKDRRPAPSVVSTRLCTACHQCETDCPYDAIRMVERTDRRAGKVAWVNPAHCVSCGICAGSCAPMGVGPPGRTGRDQLARVRDFVGGDAYRAGAIVVVACGRSGGAGRGGSNTRRASPDSDRAGEGPARFPVSCAGNLHTSVVEYLVRAGARGVLVAACPPRDCWGREGPKWLVERLYHEREAELKARVDRRRVQVAHASAFDTRSVDRALREFAAELARLESPAGEEAIRIDTDCEVPEGAGEDDAGAGPRGPSGVVSRLLPGALFRRWPAGTGRTKARGE